MAVTYLVGPRQSHRARLAGLAVGQEVVVPNALGSYIPSSAKPSYGSVLQTFHLQMSGLLRTDMSGAYLGLFRFTRDYFLPISHYIYLFIYHGIHYLLIYLWGCAPFIHLFTYLAICLLGVYTIFICLLVYWRCACVTLHIWGPEDNLQALTPSIYFVESWRLNSGCQAWQ